MDAQKSLIDHGPRDQDRSSGSTNFSIPRKPVANVTVSTPQSQSPEFAAESRRLACRSWALELVAATISASSAIALTILIFLENGKPLTAWRFVFSLNTVISILGTISKLSLALCISAAIGQQKWNFFQRRECEVGGFAKFDAASRGPWGSCQLLLWLKARHLASLGALVTIVAISNDPFLQATIYYTGSLAPVSSESPRIGRIERLDMGIIESEETSSVAVINTPYGVYMEGFFTQTDFRFASAVYVGIDNSTIRQEPVFTCISGNCTWPSYTSVALCNTCRDVSSHIKKTTMPINWQNKKEASDQLLNPVTATDRTFTNYSLPYSRIKSYDFPLIEYDSVDLTLLTLNMTADYRETISFRDMDTLLVAFLVMRAGHDFEYGTLPWNESAPTATECGLYFCVQRYDTKSENGKFQENITGTWAIREPDSWDATYDLNSPNGGDESTYKRWTADHPTLSHQYTTQRARRTDLQLSIPASDSLNKAKERFNISQRSIASFQDFLLSWGIGQSYNVGPSYYDQKISIPDAPPSNSVSVYPFNSYQKIRSMDHPILTMLHASNNLSSTFDTLASTLTTKLRDSNVTTFGQVERWQIYVKVRWPFLAVPLLTTLIGLIYTAAVIVQTSRARLPTWKEDILPILAYGLPNQIQQQMRARYHRTSQNQFMDQSHHRSASWHDIEKTMLLHFDRGSGLHAKNIVQTKT